MARNIQSQFKEKGSESQVASYFYPEAGHVIAPGMPSDLNEVELGNAQILVLGVHSKANAAASKDILAIAKATIKSPICYARNLEL